MTLSAAASAAPLLAEAHLFLEAAKKSPTSSQDLVIRAGELLRARTSLLITAGIESDPENDEALAEMARAALSIQSVVQARAVHRFLPVVASYCVEVVADEHAECDDPSDHVHLAIQAEQWDELGKSLELDGDDFEQFGATLNCLSLSDPGVAAAYISSPVSKVVVQEVIDAYPLPDGPDDYFEGADVNDEPASPSAVAEALLDDQKAIEFVEARIQRQHGSPVHSDILLRAARGARNTWAKTNDDAWMREAMFFDEVRFARTVRQEFPDLLTVVVSVSEERDVSLKIMSSSEEFNPDRVKDLVSDLIMREGSLMFAARTGWESVIELDQRLDAVPA